MPSNICDVLYSLNSAYTATTPKTPLTTRTHWHQYCNFSEAQIWTPWWWFM